MCCTWSAVPSKRWLQTTQPRKLKRQTLRKCKRSRPLTPNPHQLKLRQPANMPMGPTRVRLPMRFMGCCRLRPRSRAANSPTLRGSNIPTTERRAHKLISKRCRSLTARLLPHKVHRSMGCQAQHKPARRLSNRSRGLSRKQKIVSTYAGICRRPA